VSRRPIIIDALLQVWWTVLNWNQCHAYNTI